MAPGQRVQFSAKAVNAWNLAARKAARSRDHGAGPEGFDALPPLLVVPIRNDTGEDLAAFSVLTLGEAVLVQDEPLDVMLQNREDPLMQGRVPEEDKVFVITIEAIPKDGIGRAAVQGVVPAWVELSAPDNQYADYEPGTTGLLVSGASGPARILWHEPVNPTEFTDGTDAELPIVWALVLLNGAGSGKGELDLCGSPEDCPEPPDDECGNCDPASELIEKVDLIVYNNKDFQVKKLLVDANVTDFTDLTGATDITGMTDDEIDHLITCGHKQKKYKVIAQIKTRGWDGEFQPLRIICCQDDELKLGKYNVCVERGLIKNVYPLPSDCDEEVTG